MTGQVPLHNPRAWDYDLRIRLKLWQRALADLGIYELRQRPVVLIGGSIVLLYILAAIFAQQITIHDPTRGRFLLRFDPPAWEGGTWSYPLGADDQGRDLLTRIIFGTRVSLAVGILSVGISIIVGLVLGAVSGYYRGWLHSLLSRFAICCWLSYSRTSPSSGWVPWMLGCWRTNDHRRCTWRATPLSWECSQGARAP